MSMLAERRRKQKWSLNPRGKEWSADSNKFGQKLLEKMGWSAGKGLGAKEDGITEHIKVSYKNDSKGMGFKESDTQWTEHESNFSQLLNSLTGPNNNNMPNKENEIKPESLEKKSQKSRARVHYHKFTRGKDLSRYSEKDLANIFGRKNLNKIEPKEDKEIPEQTADSSDKSYGVETHNGGNMLDYFKKKMPSYKKYNVNGNKSESEDERPAFGFGFHQNSSLATFVSYVEPSQNGLEENNAEIETVPKKTPKSGELELAFTPLKKKSKKFENLNSLNDDESIDCTPKKKKKSKDKTPENIEVGLTNPAFDPMFTAVKLDKRPLEAIEEIDEDVDNNVGSLIEGEETGEVKKKSKKERRKERENKLLNIHNENLDLSDATENKKSKKSKKLKFKGTDNLCFEDNAVEIIPTVSESLESIPIKKSKKKSPSNGGTENSAFEDFPDDTIVKPNKKSKKSERIEGTDNLCFEDLTEASFYSESSQLETKTKKVTFSEIDEICYSDSDDELKESDPTPTNKKSRKRKSDGGIENSCFEDFKDGTENSQPSPSKKPKKSKKEKKSDAGVENCAFDEGFNETPVQDTEEFEVKRKNKKRKYEEAGINNPGFEDYSNKEKKIKGVEDLNLSMPEETDELVLNVSSTPSKPKDSGTDQDTKRGKKDKHARNVHSLSKQLDDCQATVENDINQARECFIGEPVESDGENSVLPNGDVKLKLKNAKFGRVPKWMQKSRDPNNPKSSYRHLIRGDVVLGFKNTNLHEIQGYHPSKQSQ